MKKLINILFLLIISISVIGQSYIPVDKLNVKKSFIYKNIFVDSMMSGILADTTWIGIYLRTNGSGGGTYTASQGITLTGSNFTLGGQITTNTAIYGNGTAYLNLGTATAGQSFSSINMVTSTTGAGSANFSLGNGRVYLIPNIHGGIVAYKTIRYLGDYTDSLTNANDVPSIKKVAEMISDSSYYNPSSTDSIVPVILPESNQMIGVTLGSFRGSGSGVVLKNGALKAQGDSTFVFWDTANNGNFYRDSEAPWHSTILQYDGILQNFRTDNVAGISATLVRSPGTLKEWFTDASSSGTGATDIYSYTVPANVLNTNGDNLHALYCFSNTSSATGTITGSFAGISLGGISSSSFTNAKVEIDITRVSATVARGDITITLDGIAPIYKYVELDPIQTDNTNVLKLIATASAGTMTARKGILIYNPKSPN